MNSNNIFRAGFILAGLANIVGILVVTHGMTSDTISTADPAVFSKFGILMIMVWGLAYLATVRFATTAILLPAVFAIEKLAYTINWIVWTNNHGDQVATLQASDWLGGFFMGGYGINDGLFCLFFTVVAIVNWRRSK